MNYHNGRGHRGTKNGIRTGQGLAFQDASLRIWASFQEPMMRWGDVFGSGSLCEQLMLHPEDPHLLDVYQHLAQDQMRIAAMSGCPFHGNPPPLRTLPLFCPGRVPIAWLSTGDVLSIPADDLCKNVLVVGPTGGGKSNWLRILLLSVLEAEAPKC